jgi:YidC/Oxa1 family membrane protein insertase
MCLIQNEINVLQREQNTANKWGMTAFLVAFSTYFPFIVPAGVGIYWIASNVFSIVVMYLVNIFIDPKKHIDYENRPQKIVLSKDEKAALQQKRQENRQRERADNKRFYSNENGGKQLVFYSAKSGFYKYFENVIEHILNHSDIVIHYVTSDPDDAIFKKDHPQIVPYYIGDKALIPFMMKMDADMVVMTMPDIQTYHIKRSLVRKDIEYVYMFHGMSSVNMIYREGAFDHYDTIFCIGPYHMEEIRATERVSNLPEKKLIPFGYGLIDNLLASYESLEKEIHDIPKILIAPSWQMGNIMESCLDDILEQLLPSKYCLIVRPHPEFVKRFPHRIKAILEKYADQFNENFMIETDFSSNVTIFTADLVVSDWSGIAFEYSYSTKRPCLLINTPMKVMNPEYMAIGIEPVDITLRDKLGVSLDIDELDQVAETVSELLANNQEYRDKIRQVVEDNLYNIGHSGEVGGEYILQSLKEKELIRQAQEDASE